MSGKLPFSLSILNLLVMTIFLFLFFTGRIEIKTSKVIVIDKNGVERIHLDPASKDVMTLGLPFSKITQMKRLSFLL